MFALLRAGRKPADMLSHDPGLTRWSFNLRQWGGLLAVLVGVWAPTQVMAAETYFAFESSPTSWVGRGYNLHITPADNWRFLVNRGTSNHIRFNIDNLDPNASRDNYYWTLELAAPERAVIVPGFYGDAARYPFQDFDQPGLTLSGNHRGNNRNGGFYEVLEAVYDDTDGSVLRFAADFTQYRSNNVEHWVVGQIRYNSTVPEPTALALVAGLGLGLLRRPVA